MVFLRKFLTKASDSFLQDMIEFKNSGWIKESQKDQETIVSSSLAPLRKKTVSIKIHTHTRRELIFFLFTQHWNPAISSLAWGSLSYSSSLHWASLVVTFFRAMRQWENILSEEKEEQRAGQKSCWVLPTLYLSLYLTKHNAIFQTWTTHTEAT